MHCLSGPLSLPEKLPDAHVRERVSLWFANNTNTDGPAQIATPEERASLAWEGKK